MPTHQRPLWTDATFARWTRNRPFFSECHLAKVDAKQPIFITTFITT